MQKINERNFQNHKKSVFKQGASTQCREKKGIDGNKQAKAKKKEEERGKAGEGDRERKRGVKKAQGQVLLHIYYFCNAIKIL